MAGDDDRTTTFDEAYVKQLREEAKGNRIKLQEATAAIEELKTATAAEKQAAAETAAKEDGKYKDLYDALRIEFDALKADLEKAGKYQGAVTKYLEAEVEGIPEDKRALVPASLSELDRLEWIKTAKAAGLFGEQKPTAPKPGDKKPGNGDDDTDVNPWKKETFNLTAQAAILAADREKAARMKAAAGIT